MKNEIKILKQIKNQRENNNDVLQSGKDICVELKIDYDTTIAVFRHLENQKFLSLLIIWKYIKYALKDITTIRITKSTHKEILKIMGEIQSRTGEISTLDDALQEMLSNYKKKSRK